ncbi:ribbon-helix-helix protein, CopG family [Reyranella sp.]|uniref:ribbon-helix-helix protein, CopG family n=1 Tax=Reyranella sp. TaxID=1929291 RepID=UPI003523584C
MARKPTANRPTGRPVTVGGTAFIGLRLPPALTGRIDAWAKAESISRSEAVRKLIERGLKRGAKPK